MIEHFKFQPFLGLASPHVQTILGNFSPAGEAPPSTPTFFALEDGDIIFCEVSTPDTWKETDKTIVMIHGLGGSVSSSYMVRISRKLYQSGYRVVRINLRGCGPRGDLAQRPYHAGKSDDVFTVLQALKRQHEFSPLILIGFSLGGNIALKLAGELGEGGESILYRTIAVCPPIDLEQTSQLLCSPQNRLYHRYYLERLREQAKRWLGEQVVATLIEFDNAVTAPQWGFKDALDYYRQCSSYPLLASIRHSCYILFASDDPFIDYQPILNLALPPFVKVGVSQYGGHMGFLGWTGDEHRYFWLDDLLLKWVKE